MNRKSYEPHINLFTRDLTSRKLPENFYFNLLVLGSTTLLAVFLTVLTVVFIQYQLARHHNDSLNEDLKTLRIKDRQLMELTAAVARLKKDNEALLDSVRTVSSLMDRQYRWTGLIDEITGLMHAEVWLDSFNADLVSGPGPQTVSVSLDGGAMTLDDVNRFVHKLEDRFLNIKVALKLVETDDLKYYTFSINMVWTENKR